MNFWVFKSHQIFSYFSQCARGAGGSKGNFFPLWNDPRLLLPLWEVAVWAQPKPKYEHIPSTKEHIDDIIYVIFTMNRELWLKWCDFLRTKWEQCDITGAVIKRKLFCFVQNHHFYFSIENQDNCLVIQLIYCRSWTFGDIGQIKISSYTCNLHSNVLQTCY